MNQFLVNVYSQRGKAEKLRYTGIRTRPLYPILCHAFLGLGIFDEAANSFNFCENAGGIATIPGGPVGFLILEIADSAVQVGYFILDIAFFILEITGSAVLVGDFIIEIAGSGVSGGFYFC